MKKALALLLSIIVLCSPVSVYASGEEDVTVKKSIFDRWSVSSDEIHPELRFIGNFIRTLVPYMNEMFFSFANLFMDNIGLPPTLTYIGSIDPFYDETMNYVKALENAGVSVMYETYEGCFHAFDLLAFTSPAKEAKSFLLDGFMYAVENYRAEN